MNLYRYVASHPTYATDPTGLNEGGTSYSLPPELGLNNLAPLGAGAWANASYNTPSLSYTLPMSNANAAATFSSGDGVDALLSGLQAGGLSGYSGVTLGAYLPGSIDPAGPSHLDFSSASSDVQALMGRVQDPSASVRQNEAIQLGTMAALLQRQVDSLNDQIEQNQFTADHPFISQSGWGKLAYAFTFGYSSGADTASAAIPGLEQRRAAAMAGLHQVQQTYNNNYSSVYLNSNDRASGAAVARGFDLLPAVADAGENIETVYHTVTSARAGQGVLDGIDPAFLNPNSRFGAAFYVSNDAKTTLAELAHHGATGTQTIRFNMNLEAAKILDLTDPAIANSWRYSGGPITLATQNIGADALRNGFSVIKYPSLRGPGVNYGILKDFDTILSPQMIVPVP
jgi:hypothetical protein